jgi:hypothetical protein
VIGGQIAPLSPPTPIIAPNTTNENFEISILFRYPERKYLFDFQIENIFLSFLGGHSPTTLGARVLSYALRAYKINVDTMYSFTDLQLLQFYNVQFLQFY